VTKPHGPLCRPVPRFITRWRVQPRPGIAGARRSGRRMLSVAWRAGRDGRPSSRVGGLVSARTGVGPTTAEVLEHRRLALRQWPRLRDERAGRNRISAMRLKPWQSARPLANLAASRADGAGTSSKAAEAVPAGSGTGRHDTEPRESDSRRGPWWGRRPDLVGEALGERECPWLPLGAVRGVTRIGWGFPRRESRRRDRWFRESARLGPQGSPVTVGKGG
jgi:hypothetical protein